MDALSAPYALGESESAAFPEGSAALFLFYAIL